MIDIAYNDLSKLVVFVSELERRFSDMTPFWNDFAADLVSDRVREVFGTEGYGTWAALDPAYAEAKAEAYPGRGILQRTGTYLAAASEVYHPGNVFVATPTEMFYGVDEGYFVSRFGENYPERHELGLGVSERRVFGLLADAELDTEISSLLEQWSAEEISTTRQEFFPLRR